MSAERCTTFPTHMGKILQLGSFYKWWETVSGRIIMCPSVKYLSPKPFATWTCSTKASKNSRNLNFPWRLNQFIQIFRCQTFLLTNDLSLFRNKAKLSVPFTISSADLVMKEEMVHLLLGYGRPDCWPTCTNSLCWKKSVYSIYTKVQI